MLLIQLKLILLNTGTNHNPNPTDPNHHNRGLVGLPLKLLNFVMYFASGLTNRRAHSKFQAWYPRAKGALANNVVLQSP